ncbi:MAG: VWA domain-containing protein [Planctomycetota bacterium]|nr:MAG: VWA domain-containing protein [Planctomycetota bacterium]
MTMQRCSVGIICIPLILAFFAGDAFAQTEQRFSRNIIIPQSRSFAVDRNARAIITGVKADVVVVEQVATTTLLISLQNPGNRRLEAEMIVPVPDGAVVKGFTFQGAAPEPTARLLPKEEARKTYDAIVRKLKDPALLEFIGYNLIQSSVFPIEPRGTQKVKLVYEHILPADGSRIDYVLPRSESLNYRVPWDVTVKIKSKKAVSAVYSPSHKLEKTRASENVITARIAADARLEPGSFLLSYLVEDREMTASLIAYPDPKIGGGYFLLLASPPAKAIKDKDSPAIKREVTLVIDRSGSMRGEKIEQVREAAFQVIGGLKKGEAFNIIIYNEGVDLFSEAPVLKTDENLKKAWKYLEEISVQGGTNIHDALVEALRQKPMEGMLPVVMFLTDGLPTIGETSEVGIRKVAEKGNPHNKRIFTFGVGVDVNAPLLDKIASETRATSTYVLPKENVEVKLGQVFKRLSGPILADTDLDVIDKDKKPAPARVSDVMPGKLPDLFEGDQLILLGQYKGNDPLSFSLSGNYLGKKRTFEFSFGLEKATTRNSFVPRLWASRKIAVLVDAIRQLGGNGHPTTVAGPGTRPDPKIQELVDEVVRLSIEFGVLTEYTAFIALEGTNLTDEITNKRTALENFRSRAIGTRSGMGAVNQSMNNDYQGKQRELNRYNGYYDKNMNRVVITSVQQVNDRTFYFKGGQWIDSRLVQAGKDIKPDEIIEFGSEEHLRLARELAAEGRQGTLSLPGNTIIQHNEKAVMVRHK